MPLSLLLAFGLLGYAVWTMRDQLALRGEVVDESANDADLVDLVNQLRDQLAALPTDYGTGDDTMTRNRNAEAFLSMIAWAEGTENAGGYRALYGSTAQHQVLMTDYTDHPARLGWLGVRLTDEQCRGAGFAPGCVSTAAGRYQINRPTWERVGVRALGRTDFSPESQDLAALELIREKGALDDVLNGRLVAAISKVRKVWASFPAAGYAGQGGRTTTQLAKAYSDAGGIIV